MGGHSATEKAISDIAPSPDPIRNSENDKTLSPYTQLWDESRKHRPRRPQIDELRTSTQLWRATRLPAILRLNGDSLL